MILRLIGCHVRAFSLPNCTRTLPLSASQHIARRNSVSLRKPTTATKQGACRAQPWRHHGWSLSRRSSIRIIWLLGLEAEEEDVGHRRLAMVLLRRRFYRRRRNAAAAAVASASSVLLLFVVMFFSVPARHGFFSGASGGGGGQRSSCQEEELQSLDGRDARCRYVRSRTSCAPTGYVDYLVLFYCGGVGPPALGGTALALWLVVLFYLLGDTASRYFCASLEGLSAALRLPPAVAGVTLLSLGNGAPDVISSVVAFASAGGGGDAGDVGLSSVLGGALFVSTIVAGVVAVVAARRGGKEAVIERRGFVRDACFLLVVLCYLLAVLVTGTVTVWSAASFLSLYAAYVLLVWTTHCCSVAGAGEETETDSSGKHSSDLAAPLLLPVVSPKEATTPKAPPKTFCRRLLDALHSPLYLPRRLTIPDIAARRWSKPYAVASALLSPLLLASIFCPASRTVLLVGTFTGAILAVAAASTTDASAPPHGQYSRLAWLTGGFLMSMLWSYLLARELVALLVSTGIIVGVPASVLGVTVLAWGNSLGDLVADVAMAMHDDRGAQTAVAGCHAGPAFNTVVGLGLSLSLAAGARYPEPYTVPVEASTYVTVGFLAAGVLWALVALPARGMKLDGVLGVGLLVIYLCFLCIRVSDAIGLLRLDLLFATTIIPT